MNAHEHARLLLRLSGGGCAVAGVGGAVAHFAERAGLKEEVRASVAATLEGLCHRALPLLGGEQGALDLVIEEFDDRLEIVLEYRGDGLPSTAMKSLVEENAAAGGGRAGAGSICTVDRVEHDVRTGTTRTVLVKYFE